MRRSMTSLRNPWIIYLLWVALCCLLFLNPLTALVQYSLGNDNASHIPVIPLIVAWLFFVDRQKLQTSARLELLIALPFAVASAIVAGLAEWQFTAATQTGISLFTLSWALLLISGFLAIFGRASFKSVWFDLAFLGFVIPLPDILLNRFIYVLQLGSAAVAEWIFNLSGVPFLRNGFRFHLAGWNIEVARECSGIRSSIALVVLAVLVAHFSFTQFWKKVVFVAAGLLMMVVKNGVRIATLTLLAKYVDPNFLFGKLHHQGGVVFFLLGLALLIPVYFLLRRGDPLAAAPRRPEALT